MNIVDRNSINELFPLHWSVSSLLQALAQRYGDNMAVQQISPAKQLSYQQLWAQVSELSDWLYVQKQVCEKQPLVVALQGDNDIGWVLVDLACQMAGVVCLPIPSFFSAQQKQHCLSAAHLLCVSETVFKPDDRESNRLLLEVLSDFPVPGYLACQLQASSSQARQEPSPVARPSASGVEQRASSVEKEASIAIPANTSKITFTSGSTGQPKGVCLSVRQQWRVARSLAEVLKLQRPKHLSVLPLATLLENIAGVYVPLLCGGRVMLINAEKRGLSGSSGLNLQSFLHCFDRWQPNSAILLPQLLSALTVAIAQGWQPPDSLEFLAVGGGKVAADLLRAARAHGLPVYEGYGLSECASVVALNTPASDQVGSVGRVLPHCRVTLKHGRVWVGGNSFLGYWGQPDSWYPQTVDTGDEGHWRSDVSDDVSSDFLCINGRHKNLIISSYGRNIHPEWVESELMSQPLLNRCVVAGEARPYLVALVGAPEVIGDDQIQTLLDQVNHRLPDYARVMGFQRLTDDQWREHTTANGRPQRASLLSQYQDHISGLYSDSSPQCLHAQYSHS